MSGSLPRPGSIAGGPPRMLTSTCQNNRRMYPVKKKLIASAAAVALGLTVGLYAAVNGGVASAAVLPATPGNVTFLSGPRIGGSTGTAINANQTVAIKAAGQSFGGVAIPATATGLVLTVTSDQSTGPGTMRVWTTDVGMPGTNNLTDRKSVV